MICNPKQKFLGSDPKSLSLFCAGALGDVINLLPALWAIKNTWPALQIRGIGQLAWMELLHSSGIIDQAVSLERPGMSALFSPNAEISRPIVEMLSSSDLVLSWIRNPALDTQLKRLGLETVFYAGPFPPRPGSGPVSLTLASVLDDIGIKLIGYHPRLSPPENYLEILNTTAGGLEYKGYIVIHPGSGSRSKNWPLDRFLELARYCRDSLGFPVVMTVGPADEEIAARLAASDDARNFTLLKDIPIEHLSGLLYGARLVIGNDSGVAHLAGALGVDTVSIYGPTDPGVWGVHQPNARNLGPDVPCAPCSDTKRRSCTDRVCLESVGLDAVFREVSDFALS